MAITGFVWGGETYFTVTELAKILGRHRSGVYAAIQTGKLKPSHMLGKLFIASSEVDRHLGHSPARVKQAVERARRRLEKLGV